MAGSGAVSSGCADGVGDGGLAEAGDGDDVAGFRLLHRDAVQAAEG